MSRTTRERKVILAVPCPTCGAERRELCRFRSEAERATARGRLLVHGQRREAWQAWKRTTPVDAWARSTNHTPGAGFLVPKSERAKQHLGPVEVEAPDLRAAVDELLELGWHVE